MSVEYELCNLNKMWENIVEYRISEMWKEGWKQDLWCHLKDFILNKFLV